jgi:tRNA-splicing ligase RtcB
MTEGVAAVTLPHVTKTDGMRVPLKSWAADAEAGALEQATNLTRLPFALHHVALMPDAHQGYGMPIGGVLFADKTIVPYAVGVDIGCGVALIETSMFRSALLRPDHDVSVSVQRFLDQVARDVPVGNGPQAQHRSPRGEPFAPTVSDKGSGVLRDAIHAAETQLGTLGGGNHFLELQADDEDRIWFMLHSGSRSVGKKVCDHWHRVATTLNVRWHSDLPHRELAYLPWETDEAQGYWNDMNIAMAWAEENRRRMAGKVISAFGRVFNVAAAQVLDVHHNYAVWENHFGQNGIVHRKGAVRARDGETVLIPGSMGTASYVAAGLGNPDSFETCQHGAGRARSRGDTRRSTSVAAMDAQLAGAGVTLVTPNRADVIDESAVAYKDIELVMAASADLVTPVRRHLPIGVVKG